MSAAETTAGADIDWRFETRRIRARLVDGRDRDLYRNLYTDPSVMTHIGAAMSDAEADVVFEKVLGYNAEWPMRARYWRLSEIASGAPVGLLSNLRAPRDPGLIELGIMLLPSWQGQRIGLEVTVKIVDLLMNNDWGLDTEAVIACHASANIRVGRLGAALDFEAVERSVPSSAQWRMSKQQWLARRDAGPRSEG